jgi:hypothetical protein
VHSVNSAHAAVSELSDPQTGKIELDLSPTSCPLWVADSAAATALDFAKNFVSLKAINRQRALMMTGPIAFAFAEAIDQQLSHAVILYGCNRYCHRSPPQQFIW